MNIIFKGSPNYNKGRAGKKIEKIVIHWFGIGSLESANTRFQNPASQVSAHFGVSQGRIWQWVKEEDTAWHSGNLLVNQTSIGIEHDAGVEPPHDLSQLDYNTSAELLAYISKKYNIPLNRSTVVGHREIKATQCPGTINIDKLISLAKSLMNPIHRLCVITSHVPDEMLVRSVADQVKARVQGLGPITIDLTFVTTDAVFHTVTTTGENGQPLVFADPNDIAAVAHQAELNLGIQFDAAALIYDGTLVIGNPPTNPVENPVIIEGFNIWSIPINWYTNPQTGEQFPESLKQYFYHEMLHSWYYICNRENPTIGIPDKVHSFNQWWQDNHAGEPGPTMEHYLIYYDSLALELKPYWPSLSNNDPISNGDPMIIINNTSTPGTKWALAQDQRVGFATFPAYQKYTAGRTVINLTLPDVEFNKIPASQAVIKE